MNPEISLIISVYKKPDFLEKIFLSLQYQSFKNFEIIIADDGSGQDIADVISKYQKILLIPIKHVWQENKGFRKTIIVNEAVIRANSEYLVFIDGDCILHHHFLRSHYWNKMKGHALSGRRIEFTENQTKNISNTDILGKKHEKISFWSEKINVNQLKRGICIPGYSMIENIFKKEYWIFGSNFSVYKSDFIAINGYDENIIGRGMEDVNLNTRLKMNGIRIRSIAREAIQYHLHHSSAPIPHSKEAQDKFINPDTAWAPVGITNH